MPQPARLARRLSVEQVEEGLVLAPKFDRDGLIPVVTTEHRTDPALAGSRKAGVRAIKRNKRNKRNKRSRSRSS